MKTVSVEDLVHRGGEHGGRAPLQALETRNEGRRFMALLNSWESYAPNVIPATHSLERLSRPSPVEVTVVITDAC